MQHMHEKILYENDKGQRVEIAYSFPFFFQELNGSDGISANLTKINAAGQDGTTVTNVNMSDRPLRLLGVIKGNSKTEIETHRKKLLQVFNPKVQGWLQYEYGDAKRKIRCHVESGPKFSKKFTVYKYQDFLIDLLCTNPYWQNLNEIEQNIAQWTGLFEFPLEIPEGGIEIGMRQPSVIVNIFNAGDVECGIKVEFKALATVVKPLLLNINTMEFIKINKTMTEGEVITVTTHFGNKRAELEKSGIKSNAFNFIDFESTFLQLDVGDNLLRYDADDGLDNLSISIYYTPQYLGV
ncbi:phage tail family protein [Sedimentibacter hydroxybenzoicus DSM 7310]|uniref:Phage tail family protein n=1 Tax=Sedimentibacter hydroxybenzoicus DSM 7310 TaxID=1123245 RepID=A0A974GW12_SEDHY|nr:phage tail family protein [Sedimentibacter hydroxybenzoicus]NYB73851.1 phage tail family protein [Sedimentibacter hydroxybenzoicus DSM 7310]